MRYLLLLAHAPDAWDDPDASAHGKEGVIEDWAAYTDALRAAGVLVDGAALRAPDSATSVQVRKGRRLLVDGPFTETKEHLIGYYVIDVPGLDEAFAWAARVPSVRSGTVEVRPVTPGSEAAPARGAP